MSTAQRSLRLLMAAGFSAFLLSGCTSEPSTSDGPPAPELTGGTVTDATGAVVRLGDLTLKYTVDAATRTGTEVVLTPSDNLAFRPQLELVGQPVDKGQHIGSNGVRADVRGSLTSGADPGGINAATLAGLEQRTGQVKTPLAGTLRVTRSGAVVETPGIDVVADLSPIQYLRFLSVPFTGQAQVETMLGPRRTDCVALWTVVDPDNTETAAALHCRLPRHVETAPGLRATLTIESDTVEDVLLAPNLFINYDTETDEYFVLVDRAGRGARVPVRVGVTDGVVRVVRGRLEEGEPLLRANEENPPGQDQE